MESNGRSAPETPGPRSSRARFVVSGMVAAMILAVASAAAFIACGSSPLDPGGSKCSSSQVDCINYCCSSGRSCCDTGSKTGVCCPSNYPHYCASTNKCYQYFTDAQNACGYSYVICYGG